ncbi:MAG: AAA family ATPase, partial [Dehalococcoidia bacterium]|nr:AAA family ATPase [Dehalococcoidia bacterium]
DPQNVNQTIIRGISSNLRSGEVTAINQEDLRKRFERDHNSDFIFPTFSKYGVAFLDASSRLIVAQQTESHNPASNPPQNLLQALYVGGKRTEQRLAKIFKDIFGMDIKLDYSGLRNLVLRVAKEFVDIPTDPRDALGVFKEHQSLDDQGDGFKSFVGVVLSLILSEGRIVLLDEPEAFLHPIQARQLGEWIASDGIEVADQVIVATHNASFLSGILQAGQKVDIYRLNRTDDRTEYNLIPAKATADLVKSPVLSSQRVLEAIFHKGVVVCEADADRAVYQSVASRECDDQEILFVHAHNKQTIKVVVDLLRQATIPVAAIADIDLLHYEKDLTELLESLGESASGSILQVREEIANHLGDEPDEEVLNRMSQMLLHLSEEIVRRKHDVSGARGALNRIRKESSKWQQFKAHGLVHLPEPLQSKAKSLLDELKLHRLFLVPVGELEGWIDLGNTEKQKWIVGALEKIHKGDTPEPLKRFIDNVLSGVDPHTA